MNPSEKTALRNALLAAHPEWAGRIWIYEQSVTVRGLGSVWLWPGLTGDRRISAADADDFLFNFDDMTLRD